LELSRACDVSIKRAGLPRDQRNAVVDLLRRFDLADASAANFSSKGSSNDAFRQKLTADASANEPPQKIDNRIALIARQSSSFYRDITSRDNSKTDRFAVKKFLIIAGSLDGVAYGVTEVENSAFAGAITLVFGYDSRLYLDIVTDERREVFKIDILRAANISASEMIACLMISANPWLNSRRGNVFKTSTSSITSAG